MGRYGSGVLLRVFVFRVLLWIAILLGLHIDSVWCPALSVRLLTAWQVATTGRGPYFILAIAGTLALAGLPKWTVLRRNLTEAHVVWLVGAALVGAACVHSIASGQFTFAILLLVAGTYLQVLSSHVVSEPGTPPNEPALDDSPLTSEREDRLGRGPLISKVVSALRSPQLNAPTIGVTGVLGSGKSTVAEFAAARLRVAGSPVVWFDAWRYSSPEDASDALVATIDDAMTEAWVGYVPQHARFRGLVGKIGRGLFSSWSWAAPLAAKIGTRIAVGQERLASTLRRTLSPDQRLVVVIDNLERCLPEVAFELLQTVSDAFRVRGLGFLLCYDDEGLLERLVEAGLVRKDQRDFLEKVVDLRVHLGAAEAGALEDILSAGIKGLFTEAQSASALAALRQVAPATPRQAKRLLSFIRFQLASAGALPEWVDPAHVLILLNIEFHYRGFIDVAERHREDASRLALRAHVASAIGRDLSESPGLVPPPLSEVFLDWGLRVPEGDRHFERLAQHAEASDVFGFELPRQLDYLQGREAPVLARLGHHAEAYGVAGDVTALRALVAEQPPAAAAALLVTAQNALFESVATAMTVARQLALAQQAQPLHEMILARIAELETDQAEIFERSSSMLTTYGALGGPFKELNAQVWQQCARLIESAPPEAKGLIRGQLSRRGVPGRATQYLASLASRVDTQPSAAALDELLATFRTRGGIYSLLAFPERFNDKMRLVSGPSSPLRLAKSRSEFVNRLEEASSDETVLDNLKAFFIALADDAANQAGLTQALLRQPQEGLSTVWHVLVRRPLNRRMWGDLQAKREELRSYAPEEMDFDEAFPVPEWAAEQVRRWEEEIFVPPELD